MARMFAFNFGKTHKKMHNILWKIFLATDIPSICLVILLEIIKFMKVISHTFLSILVAANKGEAEPERKETRVKVDEDRKHEYPFEIILYCKLSYSGGEGALGCN